MLLAGLNVHHTCLQEFVNLLGKARKDWVPQGGAAPPVWPQHSALAQVYSPCPLLHCAALAVV